MDAFVMTGLASRTGHSSTRSSAGKPWWRRLFSSVDDQTNSILEQAVDAVISIDSENNVTFFNDAAERLWGYEREEVIGRNVAQLVPAELRAEHDSYVDNNRRTGVDKIVGTSREVEIQRKDGTRIWGSLSLSKVVVNGEITYTGFVRDQTELRRARSITEQTLMQAVDGVVSIDSENCVTLYNAAAETLFGYPRDEVLGRNVSMLLPQALRGSHDDMVNANRRTNVGKIVGSSRALEIQTRSGESRWISLGLSRINIEGDISYTAFMKDITSERNSEAVEAERRADMVERLISAAQRVMQSMAQGDLTQKLDGEYDEQFVPLQEAINDCGDQLRSMVARIRDTSNSISANAATVAQSNSALSSRTESQAASLQETASSMEEMTATVRTTANNAKQADVLAADAQRTAGTGGEVVSRAIVAMQEINESSQRISDIIGVIDEIAFQTNLLALNAAVEAARAGEQGRGFAVVASEVRSLAGRSADSAKEIKALIHDSETKVMEGSRLVNESGETLREIVESVGEVSKLITDIARAGDEQAEGVDQVSEAISRMDQMTQENAAMSEETTAASDSMASDSNALQELVHYFKVGDNGGVRTPANAVPSPPLSSQPTAPVALASGGGNLPSVAAGEEWLEF